MDNKLKEDEYAVVRNFSEDVVYGIWLRIYERQQMIRDKMHDSENQYEKKALLFASNILADICNEIGEILEPENNSTT